MTNPHIDYIESYLKSNSLQITNLSDSEVTKALINTAVIEGKPKAFRNELHDVMEAMILQDAKLQKQQAASYTSHPNLAPVSSLYENPPKHMDMAITYFIWQVKRKMLDLPVNTPIFTIFYNAEQTQLKSSLIFRILGIHKLSKEPIVANSLIRSTKVSELTDSRSTQELAASYVLICDEMEGADKADREAIKRWPTAPYFSTRVLGTNRIVNSKNRTTCIGTSNKPVAVILEDPTGMRRYWELLISKPKDLDAYDNYPWKQLWESVNPHEAHPAEAFTQARKHEVQVESSLEFFLQETFNGVYPDEAYSSNDLHRDYMEFCKQNACRFKLNIREFGTQLTNMGWDKKRRNAGMVWIPPNKQSNTAILIPAEVDTSVPAIKDDGILLPRPATKENPPAIKSITKLW